MNREDDAVSNPSSNAEFGDRLTTVSRRRVLKGALVAAALALIIARTVVLGQAPPDATIPHVPNPPLSTDLANLPGDLRAVAMPAPSNLDDFVRDPVMARALGKALFWDMQVGSDGVQACASCHFRAGADPRTQNVPRTQQRRIEAEQMRKQKSNDHW